MRNKIYDVGTKVRIVSNLKDLDGMDITKNMLVYAGKETIIAYHYTSLGRYALAIDNQQYTWKSELIEPCGLKLVL